MHADMQALAGLSFGWTPDIGLTPKWPAKGRQVVGPLMCTAATFEVSRSRDPTKEPKPTLHQPEGIP